MEKLLRPVGPLLEPCNEPIASRGRIIGQHANPPVNEPYAAVLEIKVLTGTTRIKIFPTFQCTVIIKLIMAL